MADQQDKARRHCPQGICRTGPTMWPCPHEIAWLEDVRRGDAPPPPLDININHDPGSQGAWIGLAIGVLCAIVAWLGWG